MTDGVVDFLGYMVFSSFEYLAILFLIFGFFNIELRYFKIEIIGSVFLVTLASYILVIINLQNFVPLPLFLVPLLVFLFVKVFKMPIKRSTVISGGGFIFYGVLQFFVSIIAVWGNAMDTIDLSSSFGIKTYVMQTLDASIATAIGVFVKTTNGGLGFNLRINSKQNKTFIRTIVFLVVICIIVASSFYTYKTLSTIIITAVVLTLSSIIIYYLSYKTEVMEAETFLRGGEDK